MRKVLFLDVDGVLNSDRSCVAFGGFPNPQTGEKLFDMVAVHLIKLLCDLGVEIILSSTWRAHASTITDGVCGIPIYSATPHMNGCRGNEIAAWLQQNPDVTHYAIVDDDSDMIASQANNFIHIRHRNGLLLEHFEAICGVLNIDRAAVRECSHRAHTTSQCGE
jgi:hypothetical protein